MSESTIIVIAIIAAVFLALLMVVTTSRRRDTERATGRLSRETIQKDRSEEAASEVLVGAGEQRSAGGKIERLARTDVERASALPVPAEEAQPPMLPPMDPETLGVTRRQFLNRGIVSAFGLGLAGFGGAVLAFLWPSLSGGFGSKIKAGSLDSITSYIRDNKTPFYSPEGRFYINAYPPADAAKAAKVP